MNRTGKWLPLFLAISLLLCGCTSQVSIKQSVTNQVSAEKTGTNQENGGQATPGLVLSSDYSAMDQKALSFTGGAWPVYSGEDYQLVRVFDVSKYQGEIDWEKAAAENLGYVILRIGGRGYVRDTIYEDEKFETYCREASEHGINILGVYFVSYAITEKEAKEEAEWVLKKMKESGLSKKTRVFCDIEPKDTKRRNCRLSADEIINQAKTFCNTIEKDGYPSTIYTNGKWGKERLNLETFNKSGIWYANYNEVPDPSLNVCIWQFTNKGRINGISGNVDLDVAFVKVK